MSVTKLAKKYSFKGEMKNDNFTNYGSISNDERKWKMARKAIVRCKIAAL